MTALHFHPLVVRAREPVAEDAVRIVLDVPADLRDVFTGRAGQHLVVRAPFAGAGGADLRRTYSRTSAPGEWPMAIAVRRQPGGRLSTWLCDELAPGTCLDVMPPAGSFALAPAAQPGAARHQVGFVAGSGITPVIAIARALLAAEPDSRFTLACGNRSVARTMLLDDLLALKNRYVDRFALHLVSSGEARDIEHLNGRIDAAAVARLAAHAFAAGAVDAYWLCGPGSFNDTVRDALLAHGVADGRIHREWFGAVPAGAGTARRAAAVAPAAGTRVTLHVDGRSVQFDVPADAPSVLDAALDAGIEMPYSCCAGVCSTCRVRVLSGQAAMDDAFALEPAEIARGFVLACQARPTTPELVLTLDER